MARELVVLLWSALLALLYIIVQAQLMRRQVGYGQENANRDHDPEPNVLAARANRALRNFLETYPVFIALVVVAVLSSRSGSLTVGGAWLWFGARLVYLPAYLAGIGFYRSAIWSVSILGLLAMFAGIFWG